MCIRDRLRPRRDGGGGQSSGGGGGAALPATVSYMLGRRGMIMARHMFGFSREDEIGDLYLIIYAEDAGAAFGSAPPHRLGGVLHSPAALGERTCVRVTPAASAQAHSGLELRLKSSHYASTWAFTKLDLLRHLPAHLESVVLLDTDVYCLGDCMRRVGRELHKMRPTRRMQSPRQ